MAHPTRTLRTVPLALLAALVLIALPAVALAGPHEEAKDDSHAAGAHFAKVVMSDYDRVSGRFVDLASEIPAEKYDWRPAEGIRSVSETVMHVAAANWGLGQALGMEPEGGPRGRDELMALEEITDRDKTIEEVKKSIAFAKEAIEEASGQDPNEMIQIFGSEMPRSRVLMIIDTHMHEHLGQLIAYARSNDVTPPWSQ